MAAEDETDGLESYSDDPEIEQAISNVRDMAVALQELQDSFGYEILKTEMQEIRRETIKKLITEKDATALYRLQGEIKAIEAILSLPKNCITRLTQQINEIEKSSVDSDRRRKLNRITVNREAFLRP